jgi:Glycosyl hydrolases family 2, TIM barrel domain/Glycosyl hydrolases family 2, sugar binding domain/Glycosyl hydrolases family 2/Beta galactosidase small chain
MLIAGNLSGQNTLIQYLSGTDKDHTVNWDFMCTTGRNSGVWSTIPVPSDWELQGYGTFNYYKDYQNPGEQGLYKYHFNVNAANQHKSIFLVFEGSMTETSVKLNGKSAGPVHQGGFYEFKYDVTRLIQFGKDNLLEVTVSKRSSDSSVNHAERKADFWLFGGLFRPVYLEILPAEHIERVAINAQADGEFQMQVFGKINRRQKITAVVTDLNGMQIGDAVTMQPGDRILRSHFDAVKNWNPEQPNLYVVHVNLQQGDKIIHSITQRFGFRTTELRSGDGFYVNGKKIIFKGVCRHSEWPNSGRTLSRNVHLLDIGLMKKMNMNAVRMSHYPPDKEFLDLCDSLGLFVLDELTGWQQAYDTVIAKKLVRELVTRDVNHPSIVIWDNGNEGGWNRAIDSDFAIYDPQKRIVIHPWEQFNGTNTKHYPDFKYITEEAEKGKDVFFPTEFMHGLFDGGQGSALDDFWNEMMKNPRAAGGFLWSFHDEGVVRGDRHDSIDVAGNGAPDGMLGPYREKEASFYTIKEIWSPVYIDTKKYRNDFNGKLEVENRFLFTNLNKCRFEWETIALPGANTLIPIKIQSGSMTGPSVAPGGKTEISFPFYNHRDADAFYLRALNELGDTICTWSWAVRSPEEICKSVLIRQMTEQASVKENDSLLVINCDQITYFFDKRSGELKSVFNGRKRIAISGGRLITGGFTKFEKLVYQHAGEKIVLQSEYEDKNSNIEWVFESGRLPNLRYHFLPTDTADFCGIGFDYPENNITGMRWMGRGPYRVWKNRMKGQQFGVWEKKYNNTVTGESWDYPEFKGWHADFYWIKLQNQESDFSVYTDQPNIYLQMLRPQKAKSSLNENTNPPFPKTNIGFMHAISPIGTKFQTARSMGPESERNVFDHNTSLKGSLYFDFR